MKVRSPEQLQRLQVLLRSLFISLFNGIKTTAVIMDFDEIQEPVVCMVCTCRKNDLHRNVKVKR